MTPMLTPLGTEFEAHRIRMLRVPRKRGEAVGAIRLTRLWERIILPTDDRQESAGGGLLVVAKLTHIAISAVNPGLMKTFYRGVFGLNSNNPSSDAGFLTDGYINFAFNFRKPGYQAGLDHFGFEIDD